MKIVRIVLTLGLVIGVYFETGIITAISMFLIFVAIELKHLPLKKNRILWRYVKKRKDIPKEGKKEVYTILLAVNSALNKEGYKIKKGVKNG